MTKQNNKSTPTGFEFGMVSFQREDQSGGGTQSRKSGSATATPEDVLFGASEVAPELETPITGDAESLAPVRESWESASQWSEGAEDVIAGAMTSAPAEHMAAQTAPAAPTKPNVAPKLPRNRQDSSPANPQVRKQTPILKSPTTGAPSPMRIPARHRRSHRTGQILASSIAVAGLGGGAWLHFGLGSLPLAIVSAGLGIVGGVFVYILTKR